MKSTNTARASNAKPVNGGSALPVSVRTGEGLRDVLFDEIDAMRSGAGDRRRALAVAGLAQQIINTVKVELDYERHLALMSSSAGRAGASHSSVKTLKLGKAD